MTTIHGFELVREQHIAEIRTQARFWRHIKTGAELLSLENGDENKVFGITFRTPLADSTGVAHILEHSVLCGSRNYPLKDPFAELLKSSLQTFLNAFTYPDKTCYPFASQNLQDFYNLLEVYLDCVFYPLLSRATYERQGWHYELASPDEPLSYKGVVFNEMKGAYGSPDRVLNKHTQREVFPDTTYAVDSGGNPPEILDLTYEHLRTFHATYYHPSNARIFFYGDDDPARRLEIMDQHLSTFERLPIASSVELQPRFEAPKRVTQSYAASPDASADNKSMVTVSWLLPETTDLETTLGMNVLAHILVGTPASPLRKALIESGLGEDLAGSELVDELRQMFFATGLKGAASDNVDAIEQLIIRTLHDLAEQGIDPRTVEASINTIEFRLRENNTGSFPRGLGLMLRSLTTWLYDADPFGPLAFERPLQSIKSRLEAGERYFEELIRAHFVRNAHRVTLLLQPDSELSRREADAEQARLQQARATMNADDIQAIMANTAELRRVQEAADSPEALATIPTLRLDDLEQQITTIPLTVRQAEGAEILYHDLFTNGILYLDLGFDLHTLPGDLLPYVPLFGRALLEMGAGDDDFVALSQRIGSATGGIRPQLLTSAVRGSAAGVAKLVLRAKAMTSQTDELLQILQDLLLAPRLDNQQRFRQIILEEKAGQEARLVPAGHQLINARLRANFNAADWAAEQMTGVSYLFFLRELAQQSEEDWPGVLLALEKLRHALISRRNLIVNVTLDNENWQSAEPRLHNFLRAVPATDTEPATWSFTARGNEGLTIPAQVNYVGRATDLYALGYEPHGSDAVISSYLTTSWLWERVRVQGGAYGGFSVFDHRSGVWSFLSYRDPNVLPTLDIYAATGRFLSDLELSESALARGIIGAIGTTDAYQLPDAKGYTSMQRYLAGDTDEFRQRRRDEILGTTADDFRAFGELLTAANEAGAVVVMGSQAAIEAANTERSNLLNVVSVM